MSPYRSLALELPATRLVPPPTRSRRVAAVLSALLSGFVALAALSPWRQSVQGTGRVVAYAPLERQQTIEAPIDARLTRFLVSEGQHVAEGELLVELTDNDPMLRDRLDAEREVTEARVVSYEDRVRVLDERRDSVARSQRSAVAAAEARTRVAQDRLDAAEQTLAAADADLDAQVLNLARHRALIDQGLVSQRDLELAILAEARARTARDGARASRDASFGELEAARASLEQARATANAETESAIANLRSAETDRDAARTSLLRIESRVARQRTQEVRAPREGTVLRILGNAGGEQVRAGDPLIAFVPDTDARAVELWVDGNDASLVSPGRVVRLQFEGWPAVQFTGWPSVAIGTFAGHVTFIDSTDDGSGNFRVVIQPDPRGEPWPEARFLRQGVRVNGWVLLDEVRLGFELWRQLNGFPPALRNPPGTAPTRESAPRSGSRRAPSSRGSYGGSYGSSSYGGSSYGGGEGGYGEEGGGY